MEILVVLAIWFISPIPLLILWLVNRKKVKRQNALLQQLLEQQRILPDELTQAGISLPAPKPQQQMLPESAVPYPQTPAFAPPQILPADGQPVMQQDAPADALATAAARAAQIAEAEISGTELPAEPQQPESAQLGEILISSAAESAETGDILVPSAAESAETGDILVPSAAESAETVDTLVPPAAEAPAATAAKFAVPPQAQPPVKVQTKPAISVPNLPNQISAITLMLSVGVLLVIIAGLIFVRTTWGKLSDGGRLATLAAGSVLFFGTSALARRVWKLNRTGMAFFTLGAAFLPISVWAAGYLKLLGEGLSGAGNPWLIALSFGSFTVISLIAVIIYRQKSWGAAFLSGLTVTYVCIAEALTIHRDTTAAPFLIAVTVYALLLAFGARLLAPRIPQAIGSILEPFAIVVTAASSLSAWGAVLYGSAELLDHNKPCCWIYFLPALLAAFAFFSPILTERLKALTAIPTSLLAVPAFTALLIPLYNSVFCIKTDTYHHNYVGAYLALMLMICALIWLIMLLTNSLPDETRKGFLIAAGVLTAASIPAQLAKLSYNPIQVSVILACAVVILTAGWCVAARKKDSKPLHILIGIQIWTLCMIAADAFGWYSDRLVIQGAELTCLLKAGCFLLGFAATVLLLKKHRTGFSDLLLTVSPVVPLLMLVGDTPYPKQFPVQFAGLALLGGIILLYWALAFAHDTRKPQQYAFAVLTPMLLAATALGASAGLLEKVRPVWMLIFWSIASFALGTAAYLTTKRRFHGVRKLMFGLTMVPPILLSVSCEAFSHDSWNVLLLLICTAAAAGLWQLFSARGFRPLAIASFSAALFLLLEATVLLVRDQIYDGNYNYTVLMLASLWILLLSLLAIAISRRMLFFVGSDIIAEVMRFAAPAAALILSYLLLTLSADEWESFFFVYAFAFCILAWFTTKNTQIILPSVCALSLVFSIDALRAHVFGISYAAVIVLLLVFAGMAILFPYLGIVSREAEDEPKMQRRSWVLTGLGGIVPLWLLIASSVGTVSDYYTARQTEWMHFFVPVLLAGFLMHFLLFVKDETRRRQIITAASGIGVIAFWMQPLVDVSDTWLAGRLHIVPLIAFGFVLRYLYGEKNGGLFLFGVGIYTMLRLAITAMVTEETADLLFLLGTAFFIFIASFYVRQKKWFLLGGISLILTAIYMHMKLTDGKQWWLYLLAAGLVLIVVAGSNEMLKQRGDSLKSKAGRLWEEWTW